MIAADTFRAATEPEASFLGLPAGVGSACERAWLAFVSDPPGSRAMAEEVFASDAPPVGRAYAGLCLGYQQARVGDAAAAVSTLGVVRPLLEAAGDARGLRLAGIVEAYVAVAREESEKAVQALERAAAEMARDAPAPPVDRFLACHALALAYGRLGQLDQVLHHHYANLLLLEQHGASTPLAVVLLNLSSTLTAIDDWEEALELARRAVDCCGRMSNAALKRRAEINVALALRFLGRMDESLDLLQRLREEPFRDPGSDFALYINSAEALAQAGRAEAARDCLERARACAAPHGDAHQRANLAWVDGLVAARAGELGDARSKLELARLEATALRKVHVPLLPRIVQELAECHARAGDHARAFETFQQFHDAYEARLGYTTRARFRSRQSREGAAAVAAVFEGPFPPGEEAGAAPVVDRARLNEALRRALSAVDGAGGSLEPWGPRAMERIGAEAQGLGVTARSIGGLMRELASAPTLTPLRAERQAVRVRMLGEFEVEVSGVPMRFGRKRPERPLALLKYLALLGARGAPENQVADALWPDLEGDAALRTLAVNLHRLRYLLGGNDRVAHRARRLALGTHHVWCDAVAFEEALDRAAAAEDAREREQVAAQALVLYRGPLVIDEDREPWAIPARSRLHARFLLACAGHGARLAAAGRWKEAMETYGRGLAVDPGAEELCMGLARGALALGRRQEALAACHRLQEELRVAGRGRPSAALLKLEAELAATGR